MSDLPVSDLPVSDVPAAAVTHRRILRLAAPIILSNISVPLLGAVDTAVMGHLPDPAYIGGVAIGAMIFSFLYWGFGFLRMATTGFIAQAHGAGHDQEVRNITARAALLAGVLGALIIALQWPVATVAFALVHGSAQVEALARAYFDIRVWSAPAALGVYVAVGWLIGMQRTGSVLFLTLLMNGLNIALDLLFVPVMGWGIEGVAAATLISEVGAAVAAAIIILRAHRGLGGRWRGGGVFDRHRLVAMMRVNADIFIRTLCLIFAFAWFTAEGARISDTVLAANAVLYNMFMLVAYGLDAFAFAAEALVGAAIGKGDRHGYRAAIRLTTVWAALVSVLFAALFAVAGWLIIDVMTSIPAVRAAARSYLAWAVAVPLIGVWSFQLDGIFIGATRTAEMRNGMIIALAGFIAGGYLLLDLWGNDGLWSALLVFLALRALTLAAWLPRIGRAIEPRPAPAVSPP